MSHRNVKFNMLIISVFLLSVFMVFWLISCAEAGPMPSEVKKYANDWPTANQNYSNTRAAVGSKISSSNVGAATVVNDLVFTSTFNGKIYAFNNKTGDKVWEYQAPGGINGWPAVKGDTIIFPVGMGKTPELIAFKIGAAGEKPAETTAPVGGSGKEFKQ